MSGTSKLAASGDTINYDAPPTVADFMNSEAFMRFLLGPVGSGKTTGVMFEVLRRACEQRPAPDGFRHTRFVIVRNTLSQMKQTVLQDVAFWLGPIARWKSSENVIQIRAGNVRSDWYLIPLDTPENKRRLLSLQLTGAWLNEFIEVDSDLLPDLAGRLGRFPSAAMGGASWFGMVGDSNMPNTGTSWHTLLDEKIPADCSVHIQPGGLEVGAENLNYLTQTERTLLLPLNHPERLAQGRTYYQRLVNQHAGNWVKRYVHAKYGDDPDGTAVFRETFNKAFHVAPGRIEPSHDLPLTIGQDFGRYPCAVITQMNHRGQLLVLQELVATNMGLELHVAQNLRPMLANDERFQGKRAVLVGDPAGVAKNDHTEMDSFALLESLGFIAYPAPTNLVEPRLAAVESLLSSAPGGRPSILIDPIGCPNLVQAMHSKYLFAKRKDGEARSLPEKKRPWSDLADALQYACLAVQGGYQQQIQMDLMRRTRVRSSLDRRRAVSPKAWT